jgi:Holliday junction resolvase
MPNSNRGRGDYLERQVRSALRRYGWIVVRAAGSLGVADLVALRAGNTPLLISCKLTGLPPPAERFAFLRAAEQSGARPIVATREHPGWVVLYAMRSAEPRDYVLAGELKVPARPGKEPDADAGYLDDADDAERFGVTT